LRGIAVMIARSLALHHQRPLEGIDERNGFSRGRGNVVSLWAHLRGLGKTVGHRQLNAIAADHVSFAAAWKGHRASRSAAGQCKTNRENQGSSHG
jgi:hypothetical protein